MKDNFDIKIRKMIKQEEPELPEDYDQYIEDILRKLPENKRKRNRHITFKTAPVLAAAMVLIFSVTVTAAVNYVAKRMEAMKESEVQDIYDISQDAMANADHYSREMTESEKKRYEELKEAYETEGLFPEGEIRRIENSSDYDGNGVAFLNKRSMFFFPDEEMSDEELLQIIDYNTKVNYSLQEIHEKTKDAEQPGAFQKLEDYVELGDEDVVINYEGDMKAHFAVSDGQYIYLSQIGQETNGNVTCLWKMKVGGGIPEKMNVSAPDHMKFSRMTTDKEGNLYVFLNNDDKQYGESSDSEIWKIDKKGNVINKVDVTKARGGEAVMPFSMVVDNQGKYYLAELFGLVRVIDKEGNLIAAIQDNYNSVRALCLGKDGKVYGTTLTESDYRAGIVAIDVEKRFFDNVYDDILPENAGYYSNIIAGEKSDFLIAGTSGIFSYNMGDEKAEKQLDVYELPEDALECMIPGDGYFAVIKEYGTFNEETREQEFWIRQFLYKKVIK